MKKVDIGIGVFLFALCCFLFYVTFGFYQPPTQIAGPSLWPRIILICLALLSLGLIAQGVRSGRTAPKDAAAGEERASAKAPAAGQSLAAGLNSYLAHPGERRVLLAVLAVLLFNFLFKPLGFVISVPLFFIALTYILEPTKKPRDFFVRLAQALVITLVVYLVFYQLLSVRLPLGFLPKKWFY